MGGVQGEATRAVTLDASRLGIAFALFYLTAALVAFPTSGVATTLGDLLTAIWPFLLVIGLALWCRARTPGAIHAIWPLAAMPLFYDGSVQTLSMTPERYVDPLLVQVDAWLLGATGPPSWPLGGPVEELANFFYTSYYLFLPVAFLLVWRRGGLEAASRYSFAILLALAGCALIWMILPSGGYHLTGSPGGEAFGPFTAVARAVYEANPHYAAAFPSSHAAMAIASSVVFVRYGGSRLWVVWACGVAWATFYGQYHYVIDAPPGMLIGAGAALWASHTPGGVAWFKPALEGRMRAQAQWVQASMLRWQDPRDS